MSTKKINEQAKRWREERKELREVANGIKKEMGKPYEGLPTEGFEPLTEEEQRKMLFLISELARRCEVERSHKVAELVEAIEGEGEWKRPWNEASQCVGRANVYELMASLFLGKDDFYGRVKKQMLSTADEWSGAHKDDEK